MYSIIDILSYVIPSAATTGSKIIRLVIEQLKSLALIVVVVVVVLAFFDVFREDG